MEEMVLTEAEKKLMEIIWQVSPIESGKLVKIAADRIYWTKSTTYTVLRKLVSKGFVQTFHFLSYLMVLGMAGKAPTPPFTVQC